MRGRVIDFAIEGLTDDRDIYKQGICSPESLVDSQEDIQDVRTNSAVSIHSCIM